MTLAELKTTLASIGTAKALAINATSKIDILHSKLDNLIKVAELYGLTITQGQVDTLVASYGPEYNAARQLYEQAGDAMGTDAFS